MSDVEERAPRRRPQRAWPVESEQQPPVPRDEMNLEWRPRSGRRGTLVQRDRLWDEVALVPGAAQTKARSTSSRYAKNIGSGPPRRRTCSARRRQHPLDPPRTGTEGLGGSTTGTPASISAGIADLVDGHSATVHDIRPVGEPHLRHERRDVRTAASAAAEECADEAGSTTRSGLTSRIHAALERAIPCVTATP